mgnify:CR=1 FL=1
MKLLLLSLFSFLLLSLLSLTVNSLQWVVQPSNSFTYAVCDALENTFKLEHITLSPNPPRKNQNLNINMKGNLNEKIDFGTTISIKIHYTFFKVYDKTLDLCSELEKHSDSIKCPIEKGIQDIKYIAQISKEMLNGKYKISVKINQKNTKVFCINMKLQI